MTVPLLVKPAPWNCLWSIRAQSWTPHYEIGSMLLHVELMLAPSPRDLKNLKTNLEAGRTSVWDGCWWKSKRVMFTIREVPQHWPVTTLKTNRKEKYPTGCSTISFPSSWRNHTMPTLNHFGPYINMFDTTGTPFSTASFSMITFILPMSRSLAVHLIQYYIMSI